MLGLLAPLLQKQGVDPNVLLAMKGNNGFGGEGGWFMWVIFLFFLMGWGGNGFGFGNNGRGGLANEINNDYGRGLLMDAIGGNRNALSNLATQLNCTEGQIQSAISALTSQVQSVGNQVGMSGMQAINALQQGNMQIAQQTGTLQNAINNVAVGQERGFSNVAYETRRQTCDLHNAIKDATAELKAGQTAAEFRDMQDKIDHLREENGNYKSSAMMSQIVGQSLAPVNAALAGLQSEVNAIKCAQHLSKPSTDRGLTYSNLAERRSVLAIGSSQTASTINTIGHELLHVVAHICEQDNIDMFSEEPCYMMGTLCEQFFKYNYPPKA